MCDRRIASHRAVSAAVFAVMLMLSPVSGAPARGFTIGANFTGTDKVAELDASFAETGGPGGTFSFPPDTMGAVGPNHVAELINGAFAVYDKVGAIQTRSTLKKFWDDAFTASGGGLTSNNPFDPRLLYDKHSGKWYAVAVDSRDSFGSRVLVAVTTGDDPGPVNWRGFAIDADSAGTRWADFPTIGLDADGLYISNNMIDVQGGPSLSTDVTIMGVPKASLTAAVPSIGGFKKQELVGGSSSTGFSVQPALDVDNSGVTERQEQVTDPVRSRLAWRTLEKTSSYRSHSNETNLLSDNLCCDSVDGTGRGGDRVRDLLGPGAWHDHRSDGGRDARLGQVGN